MTSRKARKHTSFGILNYWVAVFIVLLVSIGIMLGTGKALLSVTLYYFTNLQIEEIRTKGDENGWTDKLTAKTEELKAMREAQAEVDIIYRWCYKSSSTLPGVCLRNACIVVLFVGFFAGIFVAMFVIYQVMEKTKKWILSGSKERTRRKRKRNSLM